MRHPTDACDVWSRWFTNSHVGSVHAHVLKICYYVDAHLLI